METTLLRHLRNNKVSLNALASGTAKSLLDKVKVPPKSNMRPTLLNMIRQR